MLMTATQGLVACHVGGVDVDRPLCLLLGAPGESPPELFDPGLQRLFTTYLAELARGGGSGLTAVPLEALPVAGSLQSASCYQVAGNGGVEPGTYCLTAAGILREARYGSGVLTLTELSGPPKADVFKPLTKPTPLPR